MEYIQIDFTKLPITEIVNEIIYISCKPSSLARDMQAMAAAGYKLKKACCVDMFPHTANVETCALFEKTDIN